MTFTIFDILILTIITFSSVFGAYKGFIHITLNILGFISSIIIAALLYPFAKNIFSSYITNELGLSLASGTAVYILSLIFCTLLTSKSASLFTNISKGIFDRFLGLILGFFRGGLISVVIFIITVLVTVEAKEVDKPDELLNLFLVKNYPKWLTQSRATLYLENVARNIITFMPEEILKSIKHPNNYNNTNKNEDVIDAINRKNKNDVKSIIQIPISKDFKDNLDEATP